jgi:hypothetical protein
MSEPALTMFKTALAKFETQPVSIVLTKKEWAAIYSLCLRALDSDDYQPGIKAEIEQVFTIFKAQLGVEE